MLVVRKAEAALVLGVLLSLAGCAPQPPKAPRGGAATLQQGFSPQNTGVAAMAVSPPLRQLWLVKGLGGVEGGVVGRAGELYVPTMKGQLVKLRARDGKVLWRFTVPRRKAIRGTPVLWKNQVCFGADDGVLRCLHQKTGKRLWRFKADEALEKAVKWQGDTFYVQSLDSNLYAVDAATGRLKWQKKTGYWLKGAVAVDGDALYLGGVDGQLRALTAAAGGELWSVDLQGPFYGAPLVSEDAVVIGGWDGQARAFFKDTGKPLWNRALKDRPGCATAPAMFGETVLLGCLDGYLYALDVDSGEIRWTFRSPGGFTAPPVVSGHRVIVGGYNHFLYVLDARTGREAWHGNLRGDIIAPVAVVDGLVVAATRKGRVYAFVGAQP